MPYRLMAGNGLFGLSCWCLLYREFAATMEIVCVYGSSLFSAIVFMSASHRRSPAPQEREGALLVLMRSPSSTIQLKPAVWPIVPELLFL